MTDLTTNYLGLQLKSPLVASSSPLTESLENIQRLEAAGAAAVVLPSIFEEQLALESNALEQDLDRGTESFAESLSCRWRMRRISSTCRWFSGSI